MKQLIEVIKNEIEGSEKINLIRNQDKKTNDRMALCNG